MEFIIGGGLGTAGYFTSKTNDIKRTNDIKETEYIKQYNKNYITNYKSNIMNNANQNLYDNISELYNKSLKDIKVVNKIYRDNNIIENYDIINKNEENGLIKDINMIKNLDSNNIDRMNNKHENFSNSLGYDSDSIFSDDNISNISNINTKVLNNQQKFLEDVISDDNIEDSDDYNEENEYENQFSELKFNHKGLPDTIQGSKQILNTFNNKMSFNPQSNFNPQEDGRYNATSDMTHTNMTPFFSSKTYGHNPMYEKEMTNYSVRKIELFSGSDQNPQFKHKSEVKALFDPVTNKVDSVTGTPNFTDFYESRYIPSDKRQSEKPFEPIRVTPGLNLGYNETGATGKNDLYRSLPKTVDQLRTIDKPKVSYNTPLNPAQKGERRGIIGDFIQKGPDRFFYNSPDSLLPTNGDHVAPAIYGKFLAPQTNRSLEPDNIHLNPVTSKVDKSTPEYLQGQFHSPFKKLLEEFGPRNVQNDTRGQIINQDTWVPNETNRQDTNYGDTYVGPVSNKLKDKLTNYDNMIPELTTRETLPEQSKTNVVGNYKSVPLINFLNYIPEVTKKEILLQDNGNNNITNISNSIKGYLFNSINAIPDETLRSLLSDKIILANNKGESERGYLFNNNNAITDQNMRNLSENNLILTNLSNQEQGYLFNHMNSIPDETLRNLVNTLYKSGGLNFKGNSESNYMFNYKNSIPDNTLRELVSDIIHLTNITGPSGEVKGYLYNYVNSLPDTTIRELTENKIVLNSISPIQMKSYLLNYINSVPDTTLKELTENTKNIIGQKGNHNLTSFFNYDNAISDNNNRNLSESTKNITGQKGNHSVTNLFNYEFATPDNTNRNLSETTKNITGQKGNHSLTNLFNYDSGVPDNTNRNLSETTKNITGQKGNHSLTNLFNYDSGVPDNTNRNLSENTKNITGTTSVYLNKEYLFNYQAGVPDNTNRNLSENTKNIVGSKGDGTQLRSRLDANNELLNTQKEIIALGRKPVPIKDNKGPVTMFTEYVFCDDAPLPKPIFSNTRAITSIDNELYKFS